MSAGIVTKSTVDGMGFDRVNQDVTGTVIISGTNVYAGSQMSSPLIFGANISGTTVRGDNIVGGAIDVPLGELKSVGIGSASYTYGAKIYAGSDTLSGGSEIWKEFPTAFTGKPIIVATDMTTADSELFIAAGSINAGSFYMEGKNASDEFSWTAIGI